ncbi:dienelactone hydrolase family protein [Mastigocladopsis repens]|uniref:dienelactone hydrolase family protein n=1 Tax=Mastigocladopsis repens TaxID=221287 RepID=UPI0002FEC0F1
MTSTEIRTTQVKVPNGDLQIDAYLAEPAKEGKFPAVIVIQEIFGVNIHIREVAENLAKEGHVAMSTTGYAYAPVLYQRTATNYVACFSPEASIAFFISIYSRG